MKKTAEEILTNIKETPVDEFSSPCSVTGKSDDYVENIMAQMTQEGVRHIPIFDGENLAGIISERDVKNLPSGTTRYAREFMNDDVYQVPSGTLLQDVVFEMSSKKIGSAIVFDKANNEYSIFTAVDALNALNEILQ